MPEQEVQTTEFDDIVGLATDEELAELAGEEESAAEEVQEVPQEAAGADETPEEGSDTGEGPLEAQGAAEGDSAPENPAVAALKAKLEELERANKGILNETRTERERRQAAEENIRKITEALQGQYDAEQAAKSQEEVPDKDEDPAGFLAHQIRQQQKEFQEWRQQQERVQTQEQQSQVWHQVAQATMQSEQALSEQHEDYYQALEYARSERKRLIAATHQHLSEEQLNAMIQQGDQLFALKQLQEGKNPAQEAYEASVRMGWKKPETTQEASEAAGTHNPASAGSTPAPATKVKTKPQTTSLSATSGRSGGRGQKITYQDFANLDTDSASGREMFDRIAGDSSLAEAIERDGYVYL